MDELNCIKEALSYDNTNKTIIYKLLYFYYKMNDKKKYDEILNKYKYCITQKFNILEDEKEVLVDLNDLYKVVMPIDELEELPNHAINIGGIIDVRNSVVEFFTSYYYISQIISKYESVLKEEELNFILSIRYIKSSNNSSFLLNFEKDNKKNLLLNGNKAKVIDKDRGNKENQNNVDTLLISIENFLSKYIFINNQPVDYTSNLTLYYNYIIWSLYEITIDVNEEEQKIIFKKEKLNIYKKMEKIHNYLFDSYFDKNCRYNKVMNYLIQNILLLLSTDNPKSLKNIEENIHLKNIENFIDHDSIKKVKRKINKKSKIFNIEFNTKKNIIIINQKRTKRKINIKYEYYSKKILTLNLAKNMNWLWEKMNYEQLQECNFFMKEDLDYLKYLIKYILSSELFKKIFHIFNNISSLADYYFNNENIEDYINRIIFVPFDKTSLGKYAITDRRILSVQVVAFPEKYVLNIKDYRIYRLLELALRVIVLIVHEPWHFIKSAYSMLTNGIISKETSYNKKIESGDLFEQILFGWVKEKNNRLNLIDLNLLSQYNECKNTAIKNYKINLITALKLLDPKLYDYDLEYFRNNI